MPSITESQLNDQIKANAPDRLYFIYGEEQYMKGQYCKRLIDICCTDLPEFNLFTLPYGETPLGEVFEAVNILPVLSDRKCVLLNNVDAEKISADDFKTLERIFSDIPQEATLILYYSDKAADYKKSAKWKKLLKAAEKYGSCIDIQRRTSNELCKMLISYAKKRNCILQQKDAQYLLEICSVKLDVLYGEMEKLVSFSQNGEITRDSIDSLVIKSTEASVFDLSKRVLKGDSEGAFEILNRLLQNREEPIIILATLSTAFCDIYRAKCAETHQAKVDSIVNDFDYRGREFRLRNAARDCRNINLGQIKKCLDALCRADMLLKGSRNDSAGILQTTVAELIGILQNRY